MTTRRIALLVAFCCTASAYAATPEEAYIGARDAAFAALRKFDGRPDGEAQAEREQKKALADLEKRLQGIIGDLSAEGFPARGAITLDSLYDGEIGANVLDGLRFAGPDDDPQAYVTTDGLLTRWLASPARWWKKTAAAPPPINDSLKNDEFYTEAIGDDAAFTKTLDIPVQKPADAGYAAAMLGGWAQDIGPNHAQEIVVALRRGGKIFIATENAKMAAAIPACDALWTQAVRRAAEAEKSGAQKSEPNILDKADADYRACYAEKAPKEAFFPAVTKAAQALLDRLRMK